MLKKLLKYDLLFNYKMLIIFYILALISAILTRIFFSIDNSTLFNIIAQILSGFTISMILNILINNIMRSWVRFKNNIYGDESYLTHTLPVEKSKIYLSKFLSAFITLFISILIITLTIFIAYYSKDNMEILKKSLNLFAKQFDLNLIGFIIGIIIVFFLEILTMLESGYTGLLIGHKFNNHKLLYSVLFGFITYISMQIILLIILFIVALFNKDIMNLFITNTLNNIGILKYVLIFGIILYALFIIIIYFINLKLFKKGVNVD